MCTLLRGDELQSFVSIAAKALRVAGNFQRSVVMLDIKVKKWKDPPEDTMEFLSQQRAIAKAMSEGLSAFCGAKKKGNATRMEKALAAWVAADLAIPLAFHVLFFSEKCEDLTRFSHFEELAVHINIYFEDMDPPLSEEDTSRLQLDVLGDSL
eukprot:3199599-Heterocapsa_arctica.AAC.1